MTITPVDAVLSIAALLLIAWMVALLANFSAGVGILALPLLSLILIIYSLVLGGRRGARQRDAGSVERR